MIRPPSPVCADNPYEQKLYSMFCGHDKDQRGWLTVDALRELCTTLELKENGTVLIAALTERCGAGEKKKKKNGGGVRITFKAFKEELLHVLGTEVCESPAASAVQKEETDKATSEQDRGSLSLWHLEKMMKKSVIASPDDGGTCGGGLLVNEEKEVVGGKVLKMDDDHPSIESQSTSNDDAGNSIVSVGGGGGGGASLITAELVVDKINHNNHRNHHQFAWVSFGLN